MLIFLDTEFTKFKDPELISIALVAEGGSEFYAERSDYPEESCNEFVRATVLPLLGRVPGCTCSSPELTERLRAWFGQLPEAATVVYDYEDDWRLLAKAVLGRPVQSLPQKLADKLLVGGHVIRDPVFEQAFEKAFTPALPRHHALADARALMAGYRAWRPSMDRVWRAR